jgi:hypothetical protein
MFTRQPYQPPVLSGDAARDVDTLSRTIAEYLRGLNQKDALAIFERGTWTPTDASGAGLALTITQATYTRGLNMVYGQAYIVYPATASGLAASIGGLPVAASKAHVAPMIANSAVAMAAGLLTGTAIAPLSTVGAAITNANLTGATVFLSFCYQI